MKWHGSLVSKECYFSGVYFVKNVLYYNIFILRAGKSKLNIIEPVNNLTQKFHHVEETNNTQKQNTSKIK